MSGVEVPPTHVLSSVLSDDACSVSSSSSPAPFLALSAQELSDFCVLQSFRAHADTPRILTTLPPVSNSPLIFDEFFYLPVSLLMIQFFFLLMQKFLAMLHFPLT
jgi:hypothetical protein